MNNTSHLKHAVNMDTRAMTIERMIAFGAAIACLGVLAYLLVRGEPFADPNLAVIARIFMSLAAAIFGTTVSGIFMISWSKPGLVVRAGGALALFLVTFWGTPTIAVEALGPPQVQLQRPKVIDIRAFNGPKVSYTEMLDDGAVVIARMAYANEAQPAKNAFLTAEQVTVDFDGHHYRFDWDYIVNIFPGAGCWPCIQQSVSPMAVPSGETIAHETLFSSERKITWDELIQTLLDSSTPTITFQLIATVDQESKITECTVTDLDYWRAVVAEWRTHHQDRLPAKLTLPCAE